MVLNASLSVFFLLFSFLIDEVSCACLLRVAIFSAPERFEFRQAHRNAWLLDLPNDWRYHFISGINRTLHIESKNQNQNENEKDMIWIDEPANYDNFTLRTIAWWKIAAFKERQDPCRYQFKMDDNVMPNVPLIAHTIARGEQNDKRAKQKRKQKEEKEKEKKTCDGRFVFGYNLDLHVPRDGKYFDHWFEHDWYAPGLSGTGFIFSSAFLPFLATIEKDKWTMCKNEDRCLFCWLAPFDICWVHVNGFFFNRYPKKSFLWDNHDLQIPTAAFFERQRNVQKNKRQKDKNINMYLTLKNLQDRMGNRMFQYASLLGIAYDLGLEKTNSFSFPKDDILTPFLASTPFQKMPRKKNWIKIEQPKFGAFVNVSSIILEQQDELLAYNSKRKNAKWQTSILSSMEVAFNLDGLFQSYKYFERQWPLIKGFLEPKQELSNEATKIFEAHKMHARSKNECKEWIGVHVRGGDKKTTAAYWSPDEKFMARTLKWMHTKHPRACFIVVSDDMEFVDEIWPTSSWLDDLKVHFHEKHKNHLIDFLLLSMMDHLIFTEGTFGWWAAWFLWQNKPNERPDIVTNMIHIFDPVNFKYRDYFPPGWHLVHENGTIFL